VCGFVSVRGLPPLPPTPQSTGEPRVGSPVTHNPEPSTQNPPTQKKEPSASPRGTRLPEDWKPTEELIAWARDNAPGVGWSEHEKFVDYWRAIPGAKGVKLDWAATWRNWMRRASEQRSARPVSGPPSGRYLSAQEQNLQRAKIRKLRAKIADALMDQQGLDVDAAVAAAGPMAEDFVLNGVVPSIGTGYIEAEVIDTNGRPEVTE
jgi:hypothetical protein